MPAAAPLRPGLSPSHAGSRPEGSLRSRGSSCAVTAGCAEHPGTGAGAGAGGANAGVWPQKPKAAGVGTEPTGACGGGGGVHPRAAPAGFYAAGAGGAGSCPVPCPGKTPLWSKPSGFSRPRPVRPRLDPNSTSRVGGFVLGCLGGTWRGERRGAPSPRGVPRRAVPWATKGAAKAGQRRAPSGSSAVLCAAAAKDPEPERPELGGCRGRCLRSPGCWRVDGWVVQVRDRGRRSRKLKRFQTVALNTLVISTWMRTGVFGGCLCCVCVGKGYLCGVYFPF